MSLISTLERVFKRSHNPRHEDNCLDADWQAGYLLGRNTQTPEGFDDISVEWQRRGSPIKQTPAFKSWKDGYYAGRFKSLDERTNEHGTH